MRKGLVGVSLSIASALLVARASGAERSRARLELDAREGATACIQKKELEVAVERRLRRKVFSEPAELVVDVRLARQNEAWTAELVLYDDGRRELGRRKLDTQAKDCSALDASLALVVALLVDSPPEPPRETPVAPEPTPAVAPAPKPPARTTAIELPKDTFAPREPWRVVPTIAASAAVDRLPGFAFGPRVGVALLPPRFPEFRVSVGGLLPAEHTDEAGASGGRFWLIDVLFELCPLETSSDAVRLSGCLGQSIGRLGVEGLGFDQNGTESGLDLVVTAGASAWFLVARPFGVRVGLGAGFPLSRNSYGYTAEDGSRVEVWQRGYVVGTGELGLGVEL